MTTLHDIQTICNKEGMMLSLVLAQALEELEKAREDGDETMYIGMLHYVIDMILEQIDPIEE